MENTAIILIVITLFLLSIIIGLLTVLIYKMMKQPFPMGTASKENTGEASHPDVSKADFHPVIMERIKELERLKYKKSEFSCANHPEEAGEAACAICDQLFCKACVKPYKSMHLCKDHFPMVMKNDWNEVLTIKTNSHDPEEGVRLYDTKRRLFQDKSIPTYIETHYKIDVDSDNIETYLVMFSTKENTEEVKKELQLH